MKPKTSNDNIYIENNYDLNTSFNHMILNQNNDSFLTEHNKKTVNFLEAPNIPNT